MLHCLIVIVGNFKYYYFFVYKLICIYFIYDLSLSLLLVDNLLGWTNFRILFNQLGRISTETSDTESGCQIQQDGSNQKWENDPDNHKLQVFVVFMELWTIIEQQL